MPSVSGPQHRAMEAAAHGHSTLGIPKGVAQDFVAADKAAGKHFLRHGHRKLGGKRHGNARQPSGHY